MKAETNFAGHQTFSLERKHLGFEVQVPNMNFQKTNPENHYVCEDGGGNITARAWCKVKIKVKVEVKLS